MRGNQPRFYPVKHRVRSIPAYAGEPSCDPLSSLASTVYPRVCGGTLTVCPKTWMTDGLSPRMRGNQVGGASHRIQPGSIPAYAGEPLGIVLEAGLEMVYPRVCGGTARSARACCRCGGLSPRMRGNRQAPGQVTVVIGSIPAYAGEPVQFEQEGNCVKVYPRVCGGTERQFQCGTCMRGLSPRMRGNLISIRSRIASNRSIPAYAGEPHTRPHPY